MRLEDINSKLKNISQNQPLGISRLLDKYITAAGMDFNTSDELPFENPNKELENLFAKVWRRIVTDISSLASDNLENLNNDGNFASEFSNDREKSFNRFQLMINGYALLFVALIGIFSNIIGISFVSSGKRRGKLYSMLLTSLFVFNMIYLSLDILLYTEILFLPVAKSYIRLYDTIVRSGLRYSLTSSILFLISIAHARLVVIRNPFVSLRYSPKEIRNTFLRYFIPISLTSTIVALPVYWEVDVELSPRTNGVLTLVPSDLRLRPAYSILYVGFLHFGILGLFPLISLAYSSYHIIQITKTQNLMLRIVQNRIFDGRDEQQKALTRSLLLIILTFIGLHSLRVFNAFGEFIILILPNKNNTSIKYGYGVPILFDFTTSISEFLMVIYSTFTVIIYLFPNASKIRNSVKRFYKKIRPKISTEGTQRNAISRNTPVETSGDSLLYRRLKPLFTTLFGSM